MAAGDIRSITDRTSATSAAPGLAPNDTRGRPGAERPPGQHPPAAVPGPPQPAAGGGGHRRAHRAGRRSPHHRAGGGGHQHQGAHVAPQLVRAADRQQEGHHAAHRVADQHGARPRASCAHHLQQVVGEPLHGVPPVAGRGLPVAALAHGEHPVPVRPGPVSWGTQTSTPRVTPWTRTSGGPVPRSTTWIRAAVAHADEVVADVGGHGAARPPPARPRRPCQRRTAAGSRRTPAAAPPPTPPRRPPPAGPGASSRRPARRGRRRRPAGRSPEPVRRGTRGPIPQSAPRR